MRGDFQGLSPSFLFSHLFFLPAHTPFPSTYTEKLGRPLRRIHVEGFSCRTRHAFTTYGGDTTPVTAGYINKSPDFNSPDVLNIVEKTAHFLSSALGVKNIQLWVFFFFRVPEFQAYLIKLVIICCIRSTGDSVICCFPINCFGYSHA